MSTRQNKTTTDHRPAAKSAVFPVPTGASAARDPQSADIEAFEKAVMLKSAELEERLERLEPETGSLSGTVKKLMSRIGGLTTSIGALKKHYAASEARLDVLEPRSEALAESTESLHARNEELLTSVQELDQRARLLEGDTTGLTDRVEHSESRLGSLETRVDAVDGSVADLGQRADQLELGHKGMAQSLDALERTAEGLAKVDQQQALEIVDLTARHEAVVGRAEALEQVTEELGQTDRNQAREIADLGARHEAVALRADALESETEALREADERQAVVLRRLDDRVGVQDSRQAAFQTAHNRLAAQTSELEVRTEHLQMNFGRAVWMTGSALVLLAILAGVALWTGTRTDTGLLATVDERLAAVDTRVDVQGEALGRINQGLESLQSQVVGGPDGVGGLTGTVGALENNLAGVDDRLAALDTRVTGELGAIKERIYASDDVRGAPVDPDTVNGAKWLKARNPAHYVIQLGGVYQKRSLGELIGRMQRDLPADQLSHFQTVYRGRDWFVLLYGDYARFDQALKAMEALPKAAQTNQPYIRTFGGVQKKLM